MLLLEDREFITAAGGYGRGAYLKEGRGRGAGSRPPPVARESLLCHRQVARISLDAEVRAAELPRDHGGRATAQDGIEHQLAWVARRTNERGEHGWVLLGRVLE